jgi:ribosomal protein S18 acetylase RimI-like enzyme
MTAAGQNAAHDDEQVVLETLTAAFDADPLYRWLYPNPTTRPEALADNLSLSLDLARARGVVMTAHGGRAVALWSPPGVALLEDAAPFVALLQRHAPTRLTSALAGMQACAAYEPREPAWVLHVLAVHPDLQGRGAAGELLRPVLHRCDAEGVSVYLETSNARNVPFYRRFGFEVLAEIEIDHGGPIMRPMVRRVAQ